MKKSCLLTDWTVGAPSVLLHSGNPGRFVMQSSENIIPEEKKNVTDFGQLWMTLNELVQNSGFFKKNNWSKAIKKITYQTLWDRLCEKTNQNTMWI